MSIQLEHLRCPILIGRDDAWETLRDGLDGALRGGTHAHFVSGEAGIGKSRLCRVLLKEARARGLNPIVGLGSAQDTALPYGPIIDALRRAFGRTPPHAPPLQQALAPVLPALAPLLPELGPVPMDVVQDPPVLLRRRLFDALAHTLRAVAGVTGRPGSAPVVLVLEDLHWADESTLDLLQFLLRATMPLEEDEGISGQGMLVVGTFRSELLAAAPALEGALSAMLTARVAAQIELHPLTQEELGRLLAATLDHPVSSDVVEAFFERCEGNPFVAEELLHTLAAAGHLERGTGRAEVATLHLPLSLRGAVLERLSLLPDEARSMLSAAAVAGRTFDLDLLAAVTGQGLDGLLHGLRLAVRGALIEEDVAAGSPAARITGDRYRFRHALTREVIYGELLAPERRAMHAAVARRLEERLAGDVATAADGDTIEALAYHYRLAGDRVKAPMFALRAADRDRSLLAFAEARRHYAEALSYLSDHDPACLPLLETLGLLSLALLDARGAVSYLDRATLLLRRLGLARKAAVVLGEMHHLLWYVDLARFRAMVAELDTLAEAARSGTDSAGPEDGDALALYAAAALAHAIYDNHTRAYTWAQRALDLAVTLHATDPAPATLPATYKALLARGAALLHGQAGPAPSGPESHGQGTVEAGIHDLYEALKLGLRHALPEVVQLAYNALPRGLLDVGRDGEASAVIDGAEAYAQRSGVPIIGDMRGYSLLFAGRWEEGVTVMRATVAASRQLGAPSKLALELVALGYLLLARGDAAAALEAFQEAVPILEPGQQLLTLGPCLAGLARARALLNDVAAAAALFARVLDLWRSTEDRVTVVPLLLEGCLFHAGRGEGTAAHEWAAALDGVAAANPTLVTAAAAPHARGVALAAAGEHEAAQAPLREAVTCWEVLSRPYEAARARAALGASILAAAPRLQKRRAEAAELLAAAEATFQQLGARHEADRVADVRRRGGLLAQERRRQSLAVGRAPFGDLTAREREVLVLLVQGKTNREIAQALYIAEGTAELHVSRILGKLGCTTRAHAAAYAVANHLVEAAGP